jgi:hypothetical protein
MTRRDRIRLQCLCGQWFRIQALRDHLAENPNRDHHRTVGGMALRPDDTDPSGGAA